MPFATLRVTPPEAEVTVTKESLQFLRLEAAAQLLDAPVSFVVDSITEGLLRPFVLVDKWKAIRVAAPTRREREPFVATSYLSLKVPAVEVRKHRAGGRDAIVIHYTDRKRTKTKVKIISGLLELHPDEIAGFNDQDFKASRFMRGKDIEQGKILVTVVRREDGRSLRTKSRRIHPAAIRVLRSQVEALDDRVGTRMSKGSASAQERNAKSRLEAFAAAFAVAALDVGGGRRTPPQVLAHDVVAGLQKRAKELWPRQEPILKYDVVQNLLENELVAVANGKHSTGAFEPKAALKRMPAVK